MTATVPDNPRLERLLNSSARHSYDPLVDIDWNAPVPQDKWGMLPKRMSLYGTDLWDSLTEEQRLTLSWHEVASISSVGIWFEVILMQMMLRDLYDDDPKSMHMHYALTEVADECRHSTMFGKAIDHFGVPAYGPPPAIFKLGRLFTKIVRGPSSYGAILVAEEILDSWQREMLHDESIQPVVRMVSKIHVLEEARHMA
ncbi:MAG TPA: diiron oxygenase, partial [Marmoricola sp.]|nr:diiron oxygenase [Marmoricola sp.]